MGKSSGKLPNVIVILADDLGYGDVSAYGATRIQTPHMDRIANTANDKPELLDKLKERFQSLIKDVQPDIANRFL